WGVRPGGGAELGGGREAQDPRRTPDPLAHHPRQREPGHDTHRVLQGRAGPEGGQADPDRPGRSELPPRDHAAMRYAICNETFEGWPHERVCPRIAELGYTGLELAPFTLAPRITDVSSAKRAELRRQAEAAGVRIIGLHWLLAKTEGFHLTSPDAAVRKRTGGGPGPARRARAGLGRGHPLRRPPPAPDTAAGRPPPP